MWSHSLIVTRNKKEKKWSCVLASQYHQLHTTGVFFHNLKEGHKRILSNWKTKQKTFFWVKPALGFHFLETHSWCWVKQILFSCLSLGMSWSLQVFFAKNTFFWTPQLLESGSFCCHEFYKETKLPLPLSLGLCMSVSIGLRPCRLQSKIDLFFQDRCWIMRALATEHHYFVKWFTINSSYAIRRCLLRSCSPRSQRNLDPNFNSWNAEKCLLNNLKRMFSFTV